MSLFCTALGIIFGSIIFALADYRVLVPGIACLFASSLAFTTFSHRRKEILSALIFLLLMFFNYNLRSEYLEFFDLDTYLNAKQDQISLKIISNPRTNAFYQDEFILEVHEKLASPLVLVREFFLPYRVLAKAKSSQGFERGDIVELDLTYRAKSKRKPTLEYLSEKLKYQSQKIYKKDKVFRELKNHDLVFVDHKANPVQSLQEGIVQYYKSTLSIENAKIISSLLLGSRVEALPQRFVLDVRNLGLSHFFAASGCHLLILAVFLNWLFKILKTPVQISSIAIIISSVFYTALADFSPSIIRAMVFALVYFSFTFLGRKLDSKRFLVILAGLVLFIDPYTIFDIGFQLSYLATMALLIWARPIQEKFSALIRPLKYNGTASGRIVRAWNAFIDGTSEIIAVSLAVQILMLPLIIYYFNNLQIWTILANIIFSPVLNLLTVLSFIGASPLIEPLLNLFKYLMHLCSKLPFVDLKTEVDLTSLLLLTVLFNLVSYVLFIGWPKTSHWRWLIASLIFSCLCLLLAINVPAKGLTRIEIQNGQITNKEVSSVIEKLDKNYAYIPIHTANATLSVLFIKKRNSLKTLAPLLKDLREVHILVLPNLNKSDIYFETLLKIAKPQFVVCSVKEKSPKVLENLEIIGRHANTIVNSGTIYISQNQFWSAI